MRQSRTRVDSLWLSVHTFPNKGQFVKNVLAVTALMLAAGCSSEASPTPPTKTVTASPDASATPATGEAELKFEAEAAALGSYVTVRQVKELGPQLCDGLSEGLSAEDMRSYADYDPLLQEYIVRLVPLAAIRLCPEHADSVDLATLMSPVEEPDTDGDGATDSSDLRPEDPKVRTRDDVDSDRDGVADYQDAFPKDATYSRDADGDRVADKIDDFPRDDRYSRDSDGDSVADTIDAFPNDESRSEVTLAMENALRGARGYLQTQAFSRQGLIDQLSSEYGSGFKVADATWAVSQLNTDWNEQAVKSARSYLDTQAFSRDGLIGQLSSASGSQFTLEEATYAVNKIGL